MSYKLYRMELKRVWRLKDGWEIMCNCKLFGKRTSCQVNDAFLACYSCFSAVWRWCVSRAQTGQYKVGARVLDRLRSTFHESSGRLGRDAFIEALLCAVNDSGGGGDNTDGGQRLEKQTLTHDRSPRSREKIPPTPPVIVTKGLTRRDVYTRSIYFSVLHTRNHVLM